MVKLLSFPSYPAKAYHGHFLRFSHKVTRFVGKHPLLFFSFLPLRKRLGQSRGMVALAPNTELVIEGFYRSANGFAIRAFLSAQAYKVVLANRSHVPATVIRAAQWHIPMLVLIRKPSEVVLSYLMKWPYLTPRDGFGDYIGYYSALYRYREHFVVASFAEVTRDYGRVIERLNSQFGTDFRLFSHNPENVRQVLTVLEKFDHRIAKPASPPGREAVLDSEL